MIKKYEFWHPRVFETPYYLYLSLQCLFNGIGIRSLAKANYALDHGEIGIGSKLDTQMAFDQLLFLPTTLIPEGLSLEGKKQKLRAFVKSHQYPIILKSNVGCVGKGICKLSCDEDIDAKLPLLVGDYIAQEFTPLKEEYGVFYIRDKNIPKITGINKKHFPEITGNGKDRLIDLATSHPRYSDHWQSFLQYFDHRTIPAKGERIQLSFIGSHTMGCKFTDQSELITPELEKEVFSIFETQPGFNFGRLDIKTAGAEALTSGEFVVIEVNGVASLPTHMFDPKYNLTQAYRIFFEHARHLASIAKENKDQEMKLLPAWQIIQRARTNQQLLNKAHQQLMPGAIDPEPSADTQKS